MSSKSIPAVWRDPMEYDMHEHGPPYLPVTESQKYEARKFACRQAAYYDVPAMDKYAPMTYLLAVLRAGYMVHQTAHWQTRGGHYYSDHILFQRLYEDSQEFIDGVAERAIGLGTPAHVALRPQIRSIQRLIEAVCSGDLAPGAEDLVQTSLKAEVLTLRVIGDAKAAIEASGGLTEGLDDLLQGVASKHEEFVYLLKQRAGGSYAYDRR